MFQYQITPSLLKLIKDIHLTIARIENLHPSDLKLFELKKDALEQSSYSSTSIEGNPLPLTEVRKILKQRPQNLRDTEREVLQYNDTLVWLNSEIESNKIAFNEKLIIKIHSQLMKNLLPKVKLGTFRKEPVFVNDPKTRKPIFWPPDHQDVQKLVKILLDFINSNLNTLDPLILAGIFHKQFVIIHPFIDGNGRTVRLVTKTLLAQLGLNTFPLFSFETYYNNNVSKYFEKVGEKGDFYDIHKNLDFTPWLEYFCSGVYDELLRVEKLMQISNSPDESLNADQKKILEFIKEHGFIKDSDYAQLTRRAKSTRIIDFKKLVRLQLIEVHGKGPSTYYKFKK